MIESQKMTLYWDIIHAIACSCDPDNQSENTEQVISELLNAIHILRTEEKLSV